MKIKVAMLIICLSIGAVWTQSSAQDNHAAIQGWDELEFWYTPVFCDGEVVDYLFGNIKYHYVIKWKDGWVEIDQIRGCFNSYYTDEVFKYKEIGKIDYTDIIASYHFIALGNMGTRYIGFIEMDFNVEPYVFTPLKMVCN